MQTFLPYHSFAESLSCLDYRRLGKQRGEARQIYNALTGASQGWRNHPAVLMWRGYEDALALYHNFAITIWVGRGYKNTMEKLPHSEFPTYPSWLTSEFCASHRSNLLRKDPEFYGKYGWDVPHDLPYIWPTAQH